MASPDEFREVRQLIVELAARVDNDHRALFKELQEMRVQLADIQALLEASIPEGEPEEEET